MDNIYRSELDIIKQQGYEFEQTWQVVDMFEKKVAEFFGAPYGIAVDSCTHALELSLMIVNQPQVTVTVPVYTYMSVPMMLQHMGQSWQFRDVKWEHFYQLDPLPVIDAAWLWQRNSYRPGTFTCVSFQHKKHLPIGRGGIILTDNLDHYNRLQKLCRDGRDRTRIWANDDITEIGYHYYMTPDDAARGILLFDYLHDKVMEHKNWTDYKALTDYTVFGNSVLI